MLKVISEYEVSKKNTLALLEIKSGVLSRKRFFVVTLHTSPDNPKLIEALNKRGESLTKKTASDLFFRYKSIYETMKNNSDVFND